MADMIDLTSLPDTTRLNDSRWQVWERSKKSVKTIDPSLMFRPVTIKEDKHAIITVTRNLKTIPPLAHLVKLRSQLLQTPNTVVVWANYGTFDWTALNSLCTFHSDRITAQSVKEEYDWIRKLAVELSDEIQNFMYKVWHTPGCSDLQSLLCDRHLSYVIIEQVIDICNKKSNTLQKKSEFFLLNGKKDIKIKSDTRYIHMIINVTRRQDTVYVTPLTEKGSHWSYLCIDTKNQKAVYSDSLGWAFPCNLQHSLSEALGNKCDVKKLDFDLLHYDKGERGPHICNERCAEYAPIQTCGNICGVSALSLCLLSFLDNCWTAVMNWTEESENNITQTEHRILCMIRHPSDNSAELRVLTMVCIEKNDVVWDVIGKQQQKQQTIPQQQKKTVLKTSPGGLKLADFIEEALKRKRDNQAERCVKQSKSGQLTNTNAKKVKVGHGNLDTASKEQPTHGEKVNPEIIQSKKFIRKENINHIHKDISISSDGRFPINCEKNTCDIVKKY